MNFWFGITHTMVMKFNKLEYVENAILFYVKRLKVRRQIMWKL